MEDVATRLRAEKQRLEEAGPPPGRPWCEAWTGVLDAALAELHVGLDLPAGRFAVAAVGGYGRREVCPGSDVDLLLVTDGLEAGAEALLVRSVVYPLWDAGLKVGYAVRDLPGAIDAAHEPTIATSTLEIRPVAGEASLVAAVREGVLRRLRCSPWRFLEDLDEADRGRRARHGDAAEALEPDVKSGAGGQRDIQSLRWAAAGLLGEATLDALVASHYLSAADRTRLVQANELLLAVRVALHLERARPTDVLTLERHDGVAARLCDVHPMEGTSPHPGEDRADRLLRAVLLASRTVDHVHDVAWRLVRTDAERLGRRSLHPIRRPVQTELPSGAEVADGVLHLPPGDLPPDLPAQLLSELAQTGATLDRRDADRVVRAAAEQPEAFTAGAALREALVGIAFRGRGGFPALAEVDDFGLLGAVLPGWGRVRGRAQRNPLHRYSLDRHLLHAFTTVGELVDSEPWAAETAARIDDLGAFVVGVLVHDIGKAVGEPHAETGVPSAREIAAALELGDDGAALVAAMVRHHLLLPDVATRRDLADPGLLAEVAEKVGQARTLACLHLLAAADGIATGPAAWTSWRSALVATLVERLRAVLEPAGGVVLSAPPADTREEAIRVARDLGVAESVLTEHLDLCGERYASTVSARTAVRHAEMCAVPVADLEVRTRIGPGEVTGTELLDVVAVDRPGLFAAVVGVLAIHGGSVLAALATMRADGVAVDSFTVQRPEHVHWEDAHRPDGWWAVVETDLAGAVAGRLAVRARVARRAGAVRTPRRAVPEVATEVEVSADSSGETSLVEVRTADGVGVLHRVTDAMAQLALDIVAARIDTLGHEVTDVFYVRDAAGRSLDEEHAAEVVLAISTALATP